MGRKHRIKREIKEEGLDVGELCHGVQVAGLQPVIIDEETDFTKLGKQLGFVDPASEGGQLVSAAMIGVSPNSLVLVIQRKDGKPWTEPVETEDQDGITLTGYDVRQDGEAKLMTKAELAMAVKIAARADLELITIEELESRTDPESTAGFLEALKIAVFGK